jgi:hypothetical protein
MLRSFKIHPQLSVIDPWTFTVTVRNFFFVSLKLSKY